MTISDQSICNFKFINIVYRYLHFILSISFPCLTDFIRLIHTGEVMVWDTGREDEALVATSGIGDDSHREPVSKVQWVLDPDSNGKKYNVSHLCIQKVFAISSYKVFR